MPGPETCVTLARVSALGIEVHDSKYLIERIKRYFTHGSLDAKHQIKFSISTELTCPNINPAYRWTRVPVSPFNGNDVDLRAHIAMPFIYIKKRFVTPKISTAKAAVAAYFRRGIRCPVVSPNNPFISMINERSIRKPEPKITFTKADSDFDISTLY